MKTYDINDIERINRDHGQHFFDSDTKRFFRSKILPTAYQGPGGIFFVTSEQFVASDGTKAARQYTVRRFDPETGNIRSGVFQKHEFANGARVEAMAVASGNIELS